MKPFYTDNGTVDNLCFFYCCTAHLAYVRQMVLFGNELKVFHLEFKNLDWQKKS